MFYAWCNFTFIPNIKQQSHKQESKMLIEHTNRSTEDKPKIHITWSTKYMCCGALRRSTGCFNRQSLYTVKQLECVTQPSQTTLQWSTQSQQKVNVIQSTGNTKQQQKVNATKSKSTSSLDFVPKNADWGDRSLGRVSGQFDQALTKVNVGQSSAGNPRIERNPSCCFFPRVSEEEAPRWWSNQSDAKR